MLWAFGCNTEFIAIRPPGEASASAGCGQVLAFSGASSLEPVDRSDRIDAWPMYFGSSTQVFGKRVSTVRRSTNSQPLQGQDRSVPISPQRSCTQRGYEACVPSLGRASSRLLGRQRRNGRGSCLCLCACGCKPTPGSDSYGSAGLAVREDRERDGER